MRRQLVVFLLLCAVCAHAQDAGNAPRPIGFASLRGGALGLDVSDLRTGDEMNDPPASAVRRAISKAFEGAQIRLAPDARKVLKVQLDQVERRSGNDSIHCAVVRAHIIDKDQEFLPSVDVEAQRCFNEEATPSAGADDSNDHSVPAEVVRALRAINGGPKSHAYGAALAEVLANVERRIR
jgi:hypothetical protein